MPISLKHQFTSLKGDGPDNTLVQPSNWNQEHVLTQATNRLLGRTTAGTGPTEEISVGSGLSLSSGSLSAAPTNLSVTGGTTAGPTINSSTGTNATLPAASGTASGVVTTGDQTIGGNKTFSSVVNNSAGRYTTSNTSVGMYEMHLPGNVARAWYLDTAGVVRLAATNGAGVASTADLTIDTGGNLTVRGNVTAFSDARLKTDLEQITDALGKVGQLTGYTYTRVDTGERQTGVVAQDVQKVLPEAVLDGGEHLAVAYGNMVGLLIEAVKELTARVEALEAR